jgi:cellulose synthase operon protein C
VPRGWESAMQQIGSTPLPGTNPFEGKTAITPTDNADATGPLSGLFGHSTASAPPPYPQPSPPTQTVPNYLPPSQPAPYVTPYSAPSAPYGVPAGAPRPNLGSGGYGPDMEGSGQSGGPVYAPIEQNSGYGQDSYGTNQSGGLPLQAYPGQGQYPTQNAPYPQAAAQYPQQQDPAVSQPWPMSPAAREAQAQASSMQAPAYQGREGADAPKIARAPIRKQAATRNTRAPAYAQQQGYPQQQGYAPQGYPQQQAYAPQGYPQRQGYAPQGYPQQPYAQQQPYIPQPPAGYAQAYYPTQTATQPYSPATGNAPANVANAQTLGVADELAQINRAQSSTISGGIIFRNRSGEDGLSNLTDIEAPIEGRIAAGNGHVVVTATPVTLDAGTAQNSQSTLARFGSGQAAGSLVNNYGSQTASGVGLSVGYENRSFKADVGGTPLGFREENVVAGAEYDGGITDKVSYSLAVARRAVTDSLLSYAGARDQGAGLTWGGVTSSGGRGALGWDDGTSGVYVNASFQYFDGDHVETNTAEKGGGGFYTRLFRDADQTLTVGVNTTLMHYDKNQSYFTYGQGGYFSPQQYVILNIPVEYMGRTGAFTYDTKGSIGVQHYRQDASNYFPLDPTRQAAAASSGLTPDAGAVYPGMSKTGVSYSFSATGEYQLAPQLSVGATASLGNAYQYREYLAAVYVRYSFSKQSGLKPFPPTPLNSPYLSLSE